MKREEELIERRKREKEKELKNKKNFISLVYGNDIIYPST
jgi:hypothetical protein